MSKIFILIIIGLLKGQIIDPETGKTAELQYNPKTGEYYLFGLDKLKLVDGKLYTGKFIRRTNNLVYFKIVENGGSILEIEIQKISRIISENGKAIIDDLIIEKANINSNKIPFRIPSGLSFVKIDPNTGMFSNNSEGILEPFILGTEPYNKDNIRKLDNLSSINNDSISGTGSLLLQ